LVALLTGVMCVGFAMSPPSQRLRLDPADAFARHVELLADLFEREDRVHPNHAGI